MTETVAPARRVAEVLLDRALTYDRGGDRGGRRREPRRPVTRLIIDTAHVWCPNCRRVPGEPCMVSKALTSKIRAAAAAGEDLPPLPLHVEHDGATAAHMARINRADALADGEAKWRMDELLAVCAPYEFHREGRASEPDLTYDPDPEET